MNARIGNVVFDAPYAGSLELYGREAGAVAALYAELLGMRHRSRAEMYRSLDYPADAGDEVDPVVSPTEPGGIGIAFEAQMQGYPPPRWPDPAFPQQVHLDIFVTDIEAAEQLVLARGAAKLQQRPGHRIFADPVGHPFCLYQEPPAGASPPGRIGRIVFDCFSPRSLAAFYAELMGMPKRVEDSPERVVIADDDERLPMLGFQHAVCAAPRWPDPAYPEQVHLDLGFDSEAAREHAERLGAIRLRATANHHVFADPAGHPFCI